MQSTRTSRRDGAVALATALMVNALIAWQLQSLLAPASPGAAGADAPTALQVVWIAAIPRRDTLVAAPTHPRIASPHIPPVIDRPRQGRARTNLAATAAAADPTPARSMTAVYLQQAGQWAQDQPLATAPADPFANRRVPLRDQAASRFRLKRPLSVADAVAIVGVAFGNGPHPCERNPDDVAGHATGGDALALQMALDVERHCRP